MSLFQRGVTNWLLNKEMCICCLSTKEEKYGNKIFNKKYLRLCTRNFSKSDYISLSHKVILNKLKLCMISKRIQDRLSATPKCTLQERLLV